MEALRFAATKIQPPRLRAARVARSTLDDALAQAIAQQRVVLLQAPAGFGKTTALAAQVARLPAGWGAAWVSLDSDDDAERLFACLIAALEPFDLPWRSAPEALVGLAGGERADRQRAAAELLNALAEAGVAHGLVIVDDLHRLADDNAFALLAQLVERLPAQWTLVLAGRTAPPLPLARLRAAGELAEFSQDDLRFSADEAAALLAADALPAARVGELVERTAGWPAGLRLAQAALRARPAGAAGAGPLMDRHLFDYLAAEVLDDLPPALHDFLVRSSVLPELTAARAAAVSGDACAAERLDDLERRGLFATALESAERTLVLHDLFRDALQARLAARFPGELPRLLARAADGEPDTVRRVGYRLRAADWAAAEADLAAAADELFLHGGAREIARLVDAFPPAQRSARLLRLRAMACLLRWDWHGMAAACEAAVAAATAAGQRHELQHAQACLANALYPLDRNAEAEALLAGLAAADDLPPPARVFALMADLSQHFRRGQHVEMPPLYGRVLALLEAGAPLFTWWLGVPAINWTTIAGMPALIERYLGGAWQRLGEAPLPMRGELRLLQACAHLWAGRVAEAEAGIATAEADMHWLSVSGELEDNVPLVRNLVDAMHGRGPTVFARLASKIAREADAPEPRRSLWRHQNAVYGVRLSDTVGDAAALKHWAGLLRENPLEDPSSQVPRAIAARARWAAANGRWDEAVALFERLLPRLPTMDVMGQRTDLTLRAAHAFLRAGRLDDAARTAAGVADRLLAEGVRGQPLLCGPAVLQALADARWGARLSDAQLAELRAVAALAASLRGGAADAPAPEGPLSEREREVLERIAAGDSNKLIARALDISPHTVKRHVANILDKLDLQSRAQASAWWRQHG